MKSYFLLFAILLYFAATPANAVDVFLNPDSFFVDSGDTITYSCEINATALMRGYTVYLAYDTNLVDLAAPPLPGTLVASQVGLQFNYFDHVTVHPDRLEIGATVFGTDFWQGPGQIFTARFVVRDCGDAPLIAPFNPFFVDAAGGIPATSFTGSVVFACPRPPESVEEVVIQALDSASVLLSWLPVAVDTLGQPLSYDPIYRVYRTQIQPNLLPVEVIEMTADTFAVDSVDSAVQYNYYITAGN